jgi:hypothetical protein
MNNSAKEESESFKVKFDGDPVAENIEFSWMIIK